MKVKRTISSYVLLVGILGLSIVGGVLAYQVFRAAVKSQTTGEQLETIKPIDGSISKDVVDDLRQRMVFDDDQMRQMMTTTPTPIETQTQTATQAAEASPAAEPV